MQLSQNFRSEEFRCGCGCGLTYVTPRLVEFLQTLREIIDRPIRITSGIRCPKHNRAVGGGRSSWHLVGRAADITVPGLTTEELLVAVKASRLFTGIGYYPKRQFVHVDTRNRPAYWELP